MEAFKVADFSGGKADNYLSAEPKFCADIVNLWLDENGKPYTRPGLEVYDEKVPTSGVNRRVSGVIIDSEPYGYPVFTRTDTLYNIVPATGLMAEITGPTSNPALIGKTNTDFESSLVWQKQAIFAFPPSTTKPMRVYCSEWDTTPTFHVNTIGMPALGNTPTPTSAGGTGTNFFYTFHYRYVFQDYDEVVYQEDGPIVSPDTVLNKGAPDANNVTISSIPVIANSNTDNYETNSVVVASIGTTSGNAILTGFANTDSIIEGMAVSGSGIAVGSTVLSKTSTTVTLSKNSSATASVTVTFNALMVCIFRTLNNGTTSFFLGAVRNGVTSYVDSEADTTIDDRDVIYTDGGAVEYNQPPLGSKFVTVVNDFFWYATDRTLSQSLQGAPGHCPSQFEYMLAQKIKGLNNNISYPMLFCDKSIYRVEGVFDEFGDGGFELREISKVAGCVSNNAIVQIPGGLVWPGNGGFWFTDGFSVTRISVHLPTSYALWANSAMSGVYDSKQNMVHWSVANGPSSGYAPVSGMISLNLDYGMSATCSFTTWNSKNNWYPTALAYSESEDVPTDWRSVLLIGEARGYFLYQSETCYTDPIIDFSLLPEEFKKRVIKYRLESLGWDLGNDSVRKYVNEITAEFETKTEIALQFLSRRDDGGPWSDLSEIRNDGAILWGISEYGWNDDNDDVLHDWNSTSITEGMRHFPKGTLRSSRRQVAITNSKTWIARSDDMGTATTNTTLKTVTLNDTDFFWPEDCEDYEICFESDDYDYGYIIKSRTSATSVVVYDPYGTLPSGADLKWQLRGYRKFERLYLLSYTIWFDTEGDTQPPSRGDSGLVNAVS